MGARKTSPQNFVETTKKQTAVRQSQSRNFLLHHRDNVETEITWEHLYSSVSISDKIEFTSARFFLASFSVTSAALPWHIYFRSKVGPTGKCFLSHLAGVICIAPAQNCHETVNPSARCYHVRSGFAPTMTGRITTVHTDYINSSSSSSSSPTPPRPRLSRRDHPLSHGPFPATADRVANRQLFDYRRRLMR